MRGNLDNLQIRLICHPQLMLDQNRIRIFHYQSNPGAYRTSKDLFRGALIRYITSRRLGNELIVVRFLFTAAPHASL